MKAVIIYWSKTGNTEKVALAIKESLQETGMSVSLKKVEDAGEIDFFAYDLICLGFPSYRWRPPKPVDEFLNSTFRAHRKEGRVQSKCSKIIGQECLNILHLFRSPLGHSRGHTGRPVCRAVLRTHRIHGTG